MKKTISIFYAFLITSFLYAEGGIIRGKVIDKGTGEELIGATIYLDGTTIGTTTDFDGKFSLNSPLGTHTIVCSFISYETIKITEIDVKENEVTVLNFQMGYATLGLEEVIVQAKEIRRTENALLVMQKKSATLIDGISAQQMSRMGDSDAASSLKRVTGVSVQGGKYVYVRGLSDRYSKTMLNGAEIPGLDPNKNTVQMDLFPSNLIENMVVYKTFSPNLPGDFTGGLVNITTKDFPEKYTFQFSTSVGFNPQSNLNPDFLTYEGGKLDWLGMDDGTRDNPVDIKEIPYYPLQKDKLDEITGAFNKNMEAKKETSFIDHSHSVSLGNQIDFKGKPLGFIAGLTYSHGFNYYGDGQKNRELLKDQNATGLDNEQRLSDKLGEEEVLLGAMLNASYKLSNNNKIGLSLIRNQSGTSRARNLYGSRNSDEIGMYFETRSLQYVQRALSSAQLRGEHHINSLKNLELQWLSSFTLSQQDEPDLRFFSNSYYPTNEGESQYQIEQSKYDLPTRYYRDMLETNFDNKVDFTLPFVSFGAPSKLKFGTSYVYKYRQFNDSRVVYWFQFPGHTFNGSVSDFIADENIGQNADAYINDGRYGIYIQDGTEDKNSYTSNQSVMGTYIMVDMPVFEKLRVIAGLRFETTQMTVESKDSRKDKGKLDNKDLLPAINLSYSVTGKMNFRAAYTKTLARPSFRELAPFESFDFAGGETWVGNPNLERTLINNYDLRWEYFMKPGEIVSFSTFYKSFYKPIEIVDNPIAVNPEITWRNVDEATVMGFEAEVRKNLDFIPYMENFKIGANYTYVKSEVSIDPLELQSMGENAKDTRVMMGQAPYIFNGFLGYSNKDIGLNTNLAYNITGEKLAVVVKGITPDIFEQPFASLDFVISKKFGKNISIKFAAKNILNENRDEMYIFGGKTYTYKSYSTGRKFSVGFTYLII
ncbi:MAG: TonB-dependent receptor [Bacteroidota bacterium]|nr:TonB-dependent receptor [Bacteroidota bacterium]